MEKIVECVPNFSEGRDREVIEAIRKAMEGKGAKVLDVEMGAAANRTVITMAGPKEVVLEAAFEAIRVASERIDMRRHKGEHPRIGATDVCPFVPVSGVTMEECVELAHLLGRRVGEELGIPVYLYGEAATSPMRRNLADIRRGEYEGLREKLQDPEWKPDYGPATFNEKSGATVIGARPFLIAYNINLNTRDKTLATRIAVRLREQGGIARGPDGVPLKGPDGNPIKVPGLFKDLRAVGWFIEEYGIAQVSMNVLDYRKTPLHEIYKECKRIAGLFGVEVTGSEIVGLVPLEAILMAGRYFLESQGLSPGVPVGELVHIAIRSLGLSDVKPFVPKEKIIELRLASEERQFGDASLRDFIDRVSLDTPVPGGGSVAALVASLGAALTSMVASLTVKKIRLDGDGEGEGSEVKRVMAALGVEAQVLKDRALELVTKDAKAFEAVMGARKAEEEVRRKALREAIGVPLEVLEVSLKVAEMAQKVAEVGYEACLSDAGCAAAAALAGAEGAALNVLINVRDLKDEEEAAQIVEKTRKMLENVREVASETLKRVQERLEVKKGEEA